MRIHDIMNRRVAAIRYDASLERAAELLVLTQSADLAVVDEEHRFMGVVSEGDLLRASMPNLDEAFACGASHEDTQQMLLVSGRNLAEERVERLLITEVLSLSPNDSLMHAATAMVDKMIRRLPVLDDGILVGTVSRADVCWALMCQPKQCQH
ncbi:MAG: CBS domain-containing protein [Myxococcales bacterium]|nr:CBS domain-containing protein [Myxococcales bacterium]